MGSVLAVAVLPVALTTAPTVPVADVGRHSGATEVLAAPMPRLAEAATLEAAQTDTGPVRTVTPAVLPKKGEVEVSSPKGTRTWTVSGLADHDLPLAAKLAYKRAAALMARTDPSCQIRWTLLAGIGRVESDHGRYGGSRLGSDGVSHPRIIGIPLDGAGPVAAIHDTDQGRLDGDKVWDRAVGPLQFIPSTWQAAARDGDGDGRMSPFDLDDAAAAAASYLCAGSGSLVAPAAQAAAIYRYNQDDYYVALVQAFEVGYRTGVFTIPSPPVEEPPRARAHTKRHHKAAGHAGRHRSKAGTATSGDSAPKPSKSSRPSPKPSPEPGPKPTPTPSPSPKPSPSPTPAPPQPSTVTAVLTGSDATWYLGGKQLDLGVVGQLGAQAAGDFDGLNGVQTNALELAGMKDKQVTMVVVQLDSGKLGIYSINGVSLA